MANNCLVTRLKDVVDNDNLRKLGEGKIILNSESLDAALLYLEVSDSIDVYFDKPVKLVSDGTIIPAGTRLPTSSTQYGVKPTELGLYTMTFIKYTLSYCWFQTRAINPDMDNLSYNKISTLYFIANNIINCDSIGTSKNLSNLTLDVTDDFYGNIVNMFKNQNNIVEVSIGSKTIKHNLIGDISVFSDKQYLTRLNIARNKGITGDIASLKNHIPNFITAKFIDSGIGGDFKYLALFPTSRQEAAFQEVFQGTNITGSIENFVAVKRGLGETTGTMNFKWLGDGNRVSFQGVYFGNKNTYTLSWTSSTITLDDVEIQNSDVETLS